MTGIQQSSRFTSTGISREAPNAQPTDELSHAFGASPASSLTGTQGLTQQQPVTPRLVEASAIPSESHASGAAHFSFTRQASKNSFESRECREANARNAEATTPRLFLKSASAAPHAGFVQPENAPRRTTATPTNGSNQADFNEAPPLAELKYQPRELKKARSLNFLRWRDAMEKCEAYSAKVQHSLNQMNAMLAAAGPEHIGDRDFFRKYQSIVSNLCSHSTNSKAAEQERSQLQANGERIEEALTHLTRQIQSRATETRPHVPNPLPESSVGSAELGQTMSSADPK